MDYVKNELKNVYVFDLYTLLIFCNMVSNAYD